MPGKQKAEHKNKNNDSRSTVERGLKKVMMIS